MEDRAHYLEGFGLYPKGRLEAKWYDQMCVEKSFYLI